MLSALVLMRSLRAKVFHVSSFPLLLARPSGTEEHRSLKALWKA